MDNIKIREITINDIDLLQQIGEKTFAETFSSGHSEENMKAYLENGFSIEN